MTIIPHPKNSQPDVTVIVVNYNTAHLLDRMFDALIPARAELHLQIIVVDNASRDNSVALLKARGSEIELIENSVNVGFARANNQAVAKVRGRYILLLNTDAFVSSDTIQKSVQFMDTEVDCGVLGVKLVGSTGMLQPSCRYFPTPWNVFLSTTGIARFLPSVRLVDNMTWDHASIRECDWVPGCYYMIRREVLDRIGLFDPRYFVYFEEVDHCRAVRRAGWKVVYYPYTTVVHIGGESAASAGALSTTGRQLSALQIESSLLYFRKNHGVMGMLSAVALTLLGDIIISLKELLLRFDPRGSSAAAKHTWMTLRLLVATGLATRPTR